MTRSLTSLCLGARAATRPSWSALGFTFVLSLVPGGPGVLAGVHDVLVTDVTPRAFSVVWVSDEPVLDARVRIFSDPDGTAEITGSLTGELVSAAVQGADALGLVKVDVTGAQPDTVYYLRTETDAAAGLTTYPVDAPPLEVKTAVGNAVAAADGSPIANDLLIHTVANPQDAAALPGALVLLRVPAVSRYPLTAFVGADGDAASAVIDLNNLFADLPPDGDGYNAQTSPGAVIEITDYRGSLCASPADQALTRIRRLPAAAAAPPLTEAQAPAPCFSPTGTAADFDCSGSVNPIDFNEFLMRFGSSRAADPCRFHPDFDLNGDDGVDPRDFNDFLIVFGSSE